MMMSPFLPRVVDKICACRKYLTLRNTYTSNKEMHHFYLLKQRNLINNLSPYFILIA